MAESDTFAARLRASMAEKKTSFAAIGEAAGVSAQAAHKWAGGGDIQYETLRKLADCLGVDWLWLRYGNEVVDDLRRRFGATEPPDIDVDRVAADMFLAISLLSQALEKSRPTQETKKETVIPHRQNERRLPPSIPIPHGLRLSPSKPKKKV